MKYISEVESVGLGCRMLSTEAIRDAFKELAWATEQMTSLFTEMWMVDRGANSEWGEKSGVHI